MKNLKRRKIGIIRIERPWERELARENGTSPHWGDRLMREARYWVSFARHFLAALRESRRNL